MTRDDQQGRTPDAEPQPDAPARRPYVRPELRTFPLFERMALTCNPGLKGSGEEDDS